MPETRNLCAQLPLDLHQRVCIAREESGLTTAQYITNLLLEYYEMKENGGKTTMANNSRTMAFQIPEDLFQRIKAHLERETQRTGRKLTQREFVLGLIEEALEAAERQAVGISRSRMSSPMRKPMSAPVRPVPRPLLRFVGRIPLMAEEIHSPRGGGDEKGARPFLNPFSSQSSISQHTQNPPQKQGCSTRMQDLGMKKRRNVFAPFAVLPALVYWVVAGFQTVIPLFSNFAARTGIVFCFTIAALVVCSVLEYRDVNPVLCALVKRCYPLLKSLQTPSVWRSSSLIVTIIPGSSSNRPFLQAQAARYVPCSPSATKVSHHSGLFHSALCGQFSSSQFSAGHPSQNIR